MKTQSAVAKRLNKIMIDRGISQYALSKVMLTDQSTIKHILHEEYQSIRLDTLIKICDALNMTVQEFLDDTLFERSNLDVE